ncbi:porin [Conservatibacter flavescens]|uniref:Porin n=1 Tax=Conservatibacter flavescens TaxID=28161 RepID=A0A2M8S078_9PAST|nr:porin [Conservatibacter flavescens]PJG84516.1 porin [Conservatibacter flavescens]
MKKTLVALAVAAVAATSANAATVYEADGTKVELGGSLRLFLGKLGKDERGDLLNDKSRLILKASQDLGDGFKALGGFEIRFDNVNGSSDKYKFGDPRTDKLYAGFAHSDVGTVTFGRQATTGDEVDLANNAHIIGDGNNNLNTSGKKVAKFRSAEWQGFSFGADYVFGQANKNALVHGETKYGYGASLFYSRELAQDFLFDFAAGYTKVKTDVGAGNVRPTQTFGSDVQWRAATKFTYGPASLGAEYGQGQLKEGGVKTEENRNLIVSLKYHVNEPIAVYTQWLNDRTKDLVNNTKETKNTIVAGVGYRLHKNVLTYVEYGYTRTKENDQSAERDNAFGVGLRVFF